MVLHENGKSTRCRVLQSWQLPDGKSAHQLQALDNGEMITIVDDQPPGSPSANGRGKGMPKRIFHWGLRNGTPPPGVPVPPRVVVDTTVIHTPLNPPVPTPPIVQTNATAPAQPGTPLPTIPGTQPVMSAAATPANCASCDPCETAPRKTAGSFFSKLFASSTPTPCDSCQTCDSTPTANRKPGGLIGKLFPGKEQPQVVQIAAGPAVPANTPQIVVTPAMPQVATAPTAPVRAAKLSQLTVEAVPFPTPDKSKEKAPAQTAKKVTPPPSATAASKDNPVVLEIKGSDSASSGQGITIINGNQPQPAVTLLETPKTKAPSETRTEADSQQSSKSPKNTQAATDVPPPVPPQVEALTPALPAAPNLSPIAPVQPAGPVMPAPAAVTPVTPIPAAVAPVAATPVAAVPTPLPINPAVGAAPAPSTISPAPAPVVAPAPVAQAPAPLPIMPVAPAPAPTMAPVVAAPIAPSAPVRDETIGGDPKQKGPGLRDLFNKTAPATKAPVKTLELSQPLQEAQQKMLERVRLPQEEKAVTTADAVDKKDILLAPEKFNPSQQEIKLRGLPPTPTKDTSAPSAPTSKAKDWPLGSQSVLAAQSGLPTQVTYVPVPVVTVPQPLRPPGPPQPQIPEAPRLNAFVNAFTPPPAPQMQPEQQPMAGFPMPNMTNPMAWQGYGVNPYAIAQAQMMNAYAQQVMMANAAMNPYAMGQNMGYGYPMMPQRPMAQMGLPANYPGPQAPNPFVGASPYGVAQIGYAPQAAPMAVYNPAMDRRLAVPPANVLATADQLAKVLREAPYPSQREWAAQSLAALDARIHAQVVPLLLQAATQDPAASVRAANVHYLLRLSVSPESYLPALQPLRNDADPRVRQEVEQAFARPGQARATTAAGSN
jgi:hypothetical protein